jgi:serine/threonine-protein kinase
MSSHPDQIGRYRIARAVGSGAMGAVYEAFDPVIERKVAIKTVLKDRLDAAGLEEAVARFKREAQAGGRLNHPGIVAVHEYGEDQDEAYIVMEFVDGKELRQHFRTGSRFDLIDVLELMKQLLEALDYSHRQSVVHLDIKPANLMVLPGPRLKVMDFGIARVGAARDGQSRDVAGTPTHMAPEQLVGQSADARADLWSSGVILYELLTGQNPFAADTSTAVLYKVLQLNPDPPTSMQPSLPASIDAVVAKALAKPPEERFQTAREFHGALLRAFQDRAMMAPRGMTDAEHALHDSPGAVGAQGGSPDESDEAAPRTD